MTDIEQLNQYVANLFAQEDDVLHWAQAEAARNEMPAISVRPYEGRLLQFLLKAIGARRVVEIGTLAGYSGVWLARALPADGKLYTLEKSSKHARVARETFKRAGFNGKVELLEGDALTSLAQLSAKGPFDMVFIDADKTGYPDYLAWAVENLRPGGLIAAHNALRHGHIIAPEDENDQAMRAFNQAMADEPRLESTIVTMGDGMAVGIKRG